MSANGPTFSDWEDRATAEAKGKAPVARLTP